MTKFWAKLILIFALAGAGTGIVINAARGSDQVGGEFDGVGLWLDGGSVPLPYIPIYGTETVAFEYDIAAVDDEGFGAIWPPGVSPEQWLVAGGGGGTGPFFELDFVEVDGRPIDGGSVFYTEFVSYLGGWLSGGDGPAPFGTQSEIRLAVAAEGEVCSGVDDLVAWMRSPPDPLPSTEVFLILGGDQAKKFLLLTGASQLTTEDRFIFLYHVPLSYTNRNRMAVAVADFRGCLINMAGARIMKLQPGAPGRFAGTSMYLASACPILNAIGAYWSRCDPGRAADPASFSI